MNTKTNTEQTDELNQDTCNELSLLDCIKVSGGALEKPLCPQDHAPNC